MSYVYRDGGGGGTGAPLEESEQTFAEGQQCGVESGGLDFRSLKF